ncbi:hypothetical protein ACIQNU_04155 [Streptomyces sp. NPDC091292]|uniref:hypothetical protein n=1 Tax=Streptomyces sp. NPDC091292 TaxID=3365991 RepID=UPI00381EBCB5
MISDDLRRKTTGFAKEIQALLNGTISQNVRILAVAHPTKRGDDRIFNLGNHLTQATMTARRFRLKPANDKADLWMDVSFQLRLDAEQEHLMVQQSFFGVFEGAEGSSCLCHYDYERDKKDGYPDAHVQIHGQSTILAALNRPAEQKRPLGDLHFPVGGTRFRPCLEDLIEFLVVERLAVPHDGHQKILQAGRDKFQMNQLRAAIRRHPEVAREYLHKHDALNR